MVSKYRRVAYVDRCHIEAYKETKISVREMSLRLGFRRSTIYRELKRNQSRSVYQAAEAESKAKQRYKKCRKKKVLTPEVMNILRKYLNMGWSPRQICERFRLEGKYLLSPQTVYTELKKKFRMEERKLLRNYNKRGGSRTDMFKAKMKGKVSIHQRPNIEGRSRIGDWERDGMYGANKEQLLVLLDRKSRLTRMAPIGRGKPKLVESYTQKILKTLGKRVYSITNDNGPEFNQGKHSHFKVFYCDPGKPQQRGGVEHAIRLLRQYIKRKTDLTKLKRKDLKAIEDKMNFRPRACLNYKTPHEVFYNTFVALTS